jgi:hypothetical protein
MSAKPSRRRIHPAWLLGALAVTLVAAYFAPEAERGGVVLSEHAAAVAARSSAASGAAPSVNPAASLAAAAPTARPSARSLVPAGARVLSVADREAFTGHDALFKGLSVAPVPTRRVQAAPLPASAPEVPRLSLKMIGRYVDNGSPAAFVLLQEQSLVLRVGDAVGEQFRVEHIDEASLTVRHLPTEQLQSFRLDGTP